jgi:hypothetical protein
VAQGYEDLPFVFDPFESDGIIEQLGQCLRFARSRESEPLGR